MKEIDVFFTGSVIRITSFCSNSHLPPDEKQLKLQEYSELTF